MIVNTAHCRGGGDDIRNQMNRVFYVSMEMLLLVKDVFKAMIQETTFVTYRKELKRLYFSSARPAH